MEIPVFLAKTIGVWKAAPFQMEVADICLTLSDKLVAAPQLCQGSLSLPLSSFFWTVDVREKNGFCRKANQSLEKLPGLLSTGSCFPALVANLSSCLI